MTGSGSPTPVAPPPARTAPAAVPPGSRLESAWLLLCLAADLAAGPFHLVAFLFSRGRQRRRLLDALQRAAAAPRRPEPGS